MNSKVRGKETRVKKEKKKEQTEGHTKKMQNFDKDRIGGEKVPRTTMKAETAMKAGLYCLGKTLGQSCSCVRISCLRNKSEPNDYRESGKGLGYSKQIGYGKKQLNTNEGNP